MFQSASGGIQDDALDAEIRQLSQKIVINIITQAAVRIVRDQTLPQIMMSNQMDDEAKEDTQMNVRAQSITSDVIALSVEHLIMDELQKQFLANEAACMKAASDSGTGSKAVSDELSPKKQLLHLNSVDEKHGFSSPTDAESWDNALFHAAFDNADHDVKSPHLKKVPEKRVIIDDSQISDDTVVYEPQSGEERSNTIPSRDRKFIYELASAKIEAQKNPKRRVEQQRKDLSESTDVSDLSCSSLAPDTGTETGQTTVSVSTLNFMETDVSSASEYDEVVEINGREFVLNPTKIKDYSRVIKIIGYRATIPNMDTSCNVIFFNTKYLPRRTAENYEDLMGNIFVHCVKFLRETLVSNFVIIYLNSPCHPESVPSMLWLKRHINYLEYNFRKNIKKLYLVNPSFWTRAFLFFMRPFFNAKFMKKLVYVNSYQELQILLPAVNIPEDEWKP